MDRLEGRKNAPREMTPKSHPGFTDANNVSLAFGGVHKKRFSMGRKPSNTRGITSLKSF